LVQTPLQHCWATKHPWPFWVQSGLPQVPLVQVPAQHASVAEHA